ncbi:glycosyltransferase family 25 protein [Hyphomicrobium album]
MSVPILLSLYCAGSRGPLLAMIVAACATPLVLRMRGGWPIVLAAGVAWVIVSSAVLLDGPISRSLCEAVPLACRGSHRMQAWTEAFQSIKDHPWLGVGIHYRFDSDVAVHAHNGLIGLAMLYGLPLLLVFLAFLMVVARSISRERSRAERTWLTFMVVFAFGYMGSDLSDPLRFVNTHYLFLWLPLFMARNTSMVEGRFESMQSKLTGPAESRSDTLPVYFINMDRATDRRAHIEQALSQPGLLPARIASVTCPDDIAGISFAKVSTAEASCYASHITAWRALLAGTHPYCLVVEDDAKLPLELASIIGAIVASLPPGWGIVHLYSDERRAVRPLRSIEGRHTLVRYSRVPSGAVGYLISREGAKRMSVPGTRTWPVDTDTRRPWVWGLESYGVVPPIISHSGIFTGSIVERSRRRRGLRLGSPLRTPVSALWNVRRLGFGWWLYCLWANSTLRLSTGPNSRSSMTTQPSLESTRD